MARQSGRGRGTLLASVPGAIVLVVVIGGSLSFAGSPLVQLAEPAAARLTIPFLANATRPADLDFTAAECDILKDGLMVCRFRQVFLTTTTVDATSCAITTNGYEQTFRRATNTVWISESAATGDCGIVETTTLEDGGTTRWRMTNRTAATRNADRPDCRAAVPEPEVYDWRGVKRKLPCTSIQPGAIER